MDRSASARTIVNLAVNFHRGNVALVSRAIQRDGISSTDFGAQDRNHDPVDHEWR